MDLERILKKYEPIKGTDSHQELTEKVGVLYNSILKAIENEFGEKDYCVKIEASEYNELITLRLKDWRGLADIDFRPLINQAKDNILVSLRMQSGSKYSMLKPLINLYKNKPEEFEEIENKFKDSNIEWYCRFGASQPISLEKKNMAIIEKRQFLPIYCDKNIKVFTRETDDIYGEVAETIPILVDVYLKLLAS